MEQIRFLDLEIWQWLGVPLAICLALGVALLAGGLLIRALRKVSSRTEIHWDDALLDPLRGPAKFLLFVVIQFLSFRLLFLHPDLQDLVDRLLLITLIVGLGWSAHRLIGFLSGVALSAAERQDPLRSRGTRTRVAVFRRIGGIFIIVFCAALILMQFEVVRKVGVSLLASAGIAGIMIGFAAQKSIASLVAGLQIAVTQPIRLGDVLIIEGEYGTVEEIQLTFVVVKTWDLRRLVIPVSQILNDPFQNWTRNSTELLGTVEVHADYTVPVERIRTDYKEYLKTCELWNGKAVGLQVTGASERTMVLRALMSAGDSARLWDLRCQIREWMIGWLQSEDGGRYLPVLRVDPPTGQ